MAYKSAPGENWSNDSLILSKHPSARNMVVARRVLGACTELLAEPALAYVVLPEKKGRICDACLRPAENALKRCSGCVEYWYCSTECELTQHHYF